MRLVAALAGGCLMLAGCSQVSPDQKMCEKSVNETLINPETTKVMDFKSVNKSDEIVNMYAPSFRLKMDAFSSNYYMQHPDELTEKAKNHLYDAQNIYRMRFKSEGKEGTNNTYINICLVKNPGVDCECFDVDI